MPYFCVCVVWSRYRTHKRPIVHQRFALRFLQTKHIYQEKGHSGLHLTVEHYRPVRWILKYRTIPSFIFVLGYFFVSGFPNAKAPNHSISELLTLEIKVPYLVPIQFKCVQRTYPSKPNILCSCYKLLCRNLLRPLLFHLLRNSI
jgi:hypothetical protein